MMNQSTKPDFRESSVMQSMTGFGRAEKLLEEMELRVEIRSVNSRYFDFKARLPAQLSFLETSFRQEVQQHVQRGRVDMSLDLTLKATEQLELNRPLLENYISILDQMRQLGFQGNVDAFVLLQIPGIVSPKLPSLESEGIQQAILEVVRTAVFKLVSARREEGAALGKELGERLQNLQEAVQEIAGKSGLVAEHYRHKLSERLSQLVPKEILEETRLAQELIYYVERSDITEELSRLQTHLERFQSQLASTDGEPVGRNLDFLCQEMQREINTVLAKSALAEVSEIAIEAKSEIEKIREQVQNVE